MSVSTIQLIKKGEGLNIEFKRTIDSSFKIAKTIVSFANTSGGVLLVGIGDSGEIIGVDSELTELQKLERACRELSEPPISLGLRSLVLDGKNILRIEVDESLEKPHVAINEQNHHTVYIRVKDKSVPTPKLLVQVSENVDLQKILNTRHVKTLIQFLRENDTVNTKTYAKMINISDKRAERMLNDLAEKQILLKISLGKAGLFSLKLRNN